MDATDTARNLFLESAEVKQRCADELPAAVAATARRLSTCLLAGGKILACGNGGSAADAQHFVGELVNRFEIERPPLPAVALGANAVTTTATANDASFLELYAKEVQALGGPSDVLVAISTSGQSDNILKAAAAARERDMDLVILTGGSGGELAALAQPEKDHVLTVPAEVTARIQEAHILILHTLCKLLDEELFGGAG